MRRHLWSGFRATLPVSLGIAPFGIAYGTVAAQSMAPWQASLMSLAVFAGTAQFLAASMLSQGAAWLPIFVTGTLINLRLVLLSAALVPHMRRSSRRLYPLLAHMLTDESFAVSIAEFERTPAEPWFFVGSGLSVFIVWQTATLVGVGFGAAIPRGLGLEFALAASLICLLFLLVRGKRGVFVSATSAALSVALRLLGSGTWATMLATLIAVTLGVVWKRLRSPS